MGELESELESKIEALKSLEAPEESEKAVVEACVLEDSSPSGDAFLIGPTQSIVDGLRAKSVMELRRLLDLGSYTKEWKAVPTAATDASSVAVSQHIGNPSLVKVCFPVPGVPPGIALEVLTGDSKRGSWDPTFGQVLLIERDDVRGQDFIYMATKRHHRRKPGTDFCQLRTVLKRVEMVGRSSAAMHVIVLEDACHKAAPIRDGFLRATTVVSGFLIEDDPEVWGGCVVTRVVQSDLKDGDPEGAARAIAAHGPIWLEAFQGACARHLVSCMSEACKPEEEALGEEATDSHCSWSRLIRPVIWRDAGAGVEETHTSGAQAVVA